MLDAETTCIRKYASPNPLARGWCCLGLAREIATSWQDVRVRWVCAARKREAPGIFSSAPGRFSNFAKIPPPLSTVENAPGSSISEGF